MANLTSCAKFLRKFHADLKRLMFLYGKFPRLLDSFLPLLLHVSRIEMDCYRISRKMRLLDRFIYISVFWSHFHRDMSFIMIKEVVFHQFQIVCQWCSLKRSGYQFQIAHWHLKVLKYVSLITENHCAGERCRASTGCCLSLCWGLGSCYSAPE